MWSWGGLGKEGRDCTQTTRGRAHSLRLQSLHAQTSGPHLKWKRIGFCKEAKDHVKGVVSASLSFWVQVVSERDTGSGFCGWQSLGTEHLPPLPGSIM